MPPNNSKSALSRQMQRLRRQVDQIDLKLLRLLQQRTKLSGEIGRTKRRHGAEIYVPGRERELLARVAARADGALPAGAARAIFREILSSSRAAQGQAPIGLLRGSAGIVLPAARCYFGACDRFVTGRSWRETARKLESGELAVALLTQGDLGAILIDAAARKQFLVSMSIAGEFQMGPVRAHGLAERVFIAKPRGAEAPGGSRALILIECKNTAHAVKSLLTSMPRPPIHCELADLGLSRGGKPKLSLVGLTLAESASGEDTGSLHFPAIPGVTVSILGVFPAGEDYGG